MKANDLDFGAEWVCEFLGVSRATLYNYLQSGKLKSLQVKDVRRCLLEEHEKHVKKKYASLLVDTSQLSSPIPAVQEPVPISTPAWQAPPLEEEPDLISPTDSVEELLNNLPDSGGKWFK